jgi:hypothetical protein
METVRFSKPKLKENKMNKTKLNYRGFEIYTKYFDSRLGIKWESNNNIGEPKMSRILYNTEEESIQKEKEFIDLYISEND